MATEQTSRAGRFQARPKRVPLHDQRDKLTVSQVDPDRVYRWVNDRDNRLEKFKEAGYRVEENQNLKVGDPEVDAGIDSTGSAVVKQVGGGTKAVLMSIQKDWYEEDQAAKQRKVDEVDTAMRGDAEAASDYGDLRVTRRRR